MRTSQKASGAPQWTIPRIATAGDSADTNDVINTITQDAAGMLTVAVKADADRTDPGDGGWYSWPALDGDGKAVNANDAGIMCQVLIEINGGTPFGTSDDVVVTAGFMNEADLESAGVDGIFGGCKFTGGVRLARAGDLSAGSVTIADDAVGDISHAVLIETCRRSATHWGTIEANGIDSSYNWVTGAVAVGGNEATGTGALHFFLCIARNSAGVGTPTGDIKVGYRICAKPTTGLALA